MKESIPRDADRDETPWLEQWHGRTDCPSPDLLLPAQLSLGGPTGMTFLTVLGRLKPDISVEQAQAALHPVFLECLRYARRHFLLLRAELEILRLGQRPVLRKERVDAFDKFTAYDVL